MTIDFLQLVFVNKLNFDLIQFGNVFIWQKCLLFSFWFQANWFDKNSAVSTAKGHFALDQSFDEFTGGNVIEWLSKAYGSLASLHFDLFQHEFSQLGSCAVDQRLIVCIYIKVYTFTGAQA